MPWRGAEWDGEFPSLGWEILEWAEAYFRVPDGPLAGQPLTLTNEQASILARFYQLDDRGHYVFRRAAVRRAKGWGKSPLLGMIALAELCGPTRFDGWDANGEPVGIAPVTPLVQIAANAEDQTANTYLALYAMAKESDLNGSVLDVGQTRLFLQTGLGRLEPITAAAGTQEGARVTFGVLDETHLWTASSGGKKLAETIRRNVAKMNARTFESTNAHSPGEGSVAEKTYEAWKKGAAGLLYDAVEAPWLDDMTDRRAVLAGLKVAYGDARWVDLERIADEIADPATSESDARRFYFNQLVSDGGAFVDVQAFKKLASERTLAKPKEQIGLGFDGSISNDATALYGCTAEGHIFELAVWERPQDAPDDWLVPRQEVHNAVAQAFARYSVGRMLCDPPKWYTEIEGWVEKYGEERVAVLDTNQARRFAPACDRFAVAVRNGSISHDGGNGLVRHLAACAKKKVRLADDEFDGRTPSVIVKADTRKIDRAVAAILALEAAMTMPAKKTFRIY